MAALNYPNELKERLKAIFPDLSRSLQQNLICGDIQVGSYFIENLVEPVILGEGEVSEELGSLADLVGKYSSHLQMESELLTNEAILSIGASLLTSYNNLLES